MPAIINPKQHGIFVALETVPGAYVAPVAASYLATNDLKVEPNQTDKESFMLDSLNRPASITAVKKRHTKVGFKVPLQWANAAPTTNSDLLPIDLLLQICGATAPNEVTSTSAGVSYTELASASSVPSASISYRRTRSAAAQWERKIAGCRGSVGFEWEFGKIPMFLFGLLGGHIDIVQSGSLAGSATALLTNLGLASSAANTANVQINGKGLCLYKMACKNLWRTKASFQDSLCGSGALADLESEAETTLTFRASDIASAAEFNFDSYLGGTYPYTITCKGDGTFAARQLIFDYPAMNVRDVKEVNLPDNTLGIEMTLGQVEALTLTHL